MGRERKERRRKERRWRKGKGGKGRDGEGSYCVAFSHLKILSHSVVFSWIKHKTSCYPSEHRFLKNSHFAF